MTYLCFLLSASTTIKSRNLKCFAGLQTLISSPNQGWTKIIYSEVLLFNLSLLSYVPTDHATVLRHCCTLNLSDRLCTHCQRCCCGTADKSVILARFAAPTCRLCALFLPASLHPLPCAFVFFNHFPQADTHSSLILVKLERQNFITLVKEERRGGAVREISLD